jgi:hypothetical protein
MAFWRLDWWYWLLSGYGERVGHAVLSLLFVLFMFAGFYTQAEFEYSGNQSKAILQPSQAMLYSLQVGALQNPSPQPITQLAQYLVLVETIIVPLQVALLALAIRRKFMR